MTLWPGFCAKDNHIFASSTEHVWLEPELEVRISLCPVTTLLKCASLISVQPDVRTIAFILEVVSEGCCLRVVLVAIGHVDQLGVDKCWLISLKLTKESGVHLNRCHISVAAVDFRQDLLEVAWDEVLVFDVLEAVRRALRAANRGDEFLVDLSMYCREQGSESERHY